MRITTLEQLDQAVERTPLVADDGKSGSRLERIVFADGGRVVVKTIEPASDWIMRATGDVGRAAMLWTSGLLSEVPAVVDSAVLDAVPGNGGGWLLVMRDVSDLLVPPHGRLSRADSRRILDAAAALHTRFPANAVNLPWLCPLTARYATLSPATSHREEQGSDAVPKMLSRGWQRFAEVAPADVATAVLAILEDPARLAAQLERFPMTLIHGDLKLGNLGLARDRVVMLDWAVAGLAPPAVEVAWYLAVNWSRIDATREQVLEDFRAAETRHHDEEALRLALLGGLVQLGWD
ncbi:MAG: aminoglycoside phosphotransferase family protein, partial [Actinomycetota bacterium]|nr:aminoglycoside phosphotransferase family protein [Actinomycetota bacterium]